MLVAARLTDFQDSRERYVRDEAFEQSVGWLSKLMPFSLAGLGEMLMAGDERYECRETQVALALK